MRRGLIAVTVGLAIAAPAHGAIRVVAPFPLDRYAGDGAIGLAVPGAGPTVTRESALNTLLTGEVRSSILGGTPAAAPLIELDVGPPPDTLVVLPPRGKTENDRYPIAVTPGPRGVLTSDSTRIDGLVSLADIARGKLEVVEVDDPVATLERLERRIERNDRIRLPLTVLAGAIAYLTAVWFPRFAPRVLLLALAANLWLAGWWIVALVGLAAAALPLGVACGAVLTAYLLVLGLDPEVVALSPFGPTQAGRFYGVTNLLETFLLVPALLGAALLGRMGAVVAAIAVVAVAGSRFGADGGGLLVLLAAYATLLVRTHGLRIDARRGAAIAVAAVIAGVALVGLDAAIGGSSHVTDAIGDGPGAVLGDIADRLELSARRTFAGFGPAFAALASLAVLLVVATRRPRRPLTDAVLVALAVSLVVNDTPGDVLGVGAVAAFVLRRFEDTTPHDAQGRRVRLRAMRRPLTVLALLLAALALVVAGCSEGDVGATPETVEGTIPEETTTGGGDLPALELTGDAAAGKSVFASAGCNACHTLSAAGSNGTVGPNLDDAKPTFELVVQRVTLGQGGMPPFKDQLQPQQIADVAEFVVLSGRLILPPDLPRPVQAFACDLDGTLIGRDGVLRPRLRAAITRAQHAGIPVIVATGRMFRSVEPYLDDAGIDDLVICYQGAAVVDPRSRTFILHVPLELDVAREAIAILQSLGVSPNVYVEDRLYVSEETEYSRAYSNFQHLPVSEVGDLLAWLDRPPTKLVAVADPETLASIRAELERPLDGRVYLTTSLPHLLELGNPGVTKGSGLTFVAGRLGVELANIVAFGDGENDVELLEAAGFGVAIDGAHERLLAVADWTCPGPHEDGVAGVIEAVLDSTA